MKYTSYHRNILEVKLKFHLERNPRSSMCSSKETEIKIFSLYIKLHEWRKNHYVPVLSTEDRSLSSSRTRQLSRLQVSEYYLCLHWSLYISLYLPLPIADKSRNTNWNWIRSLNSTLLILFITSISLIESELTVRIPPHHTNFQIFHLLINNKSLNLCIFLSFA